jgi:hypothetical protein
MKYVRTIQWKTKIERIRDYTLRIGLGKIFKIEKKELANLRAFGRVVIMRVPEISLVK